MRAIDAGFSHLDVAPAYGDGLCESELGRILGMRRHAVTIATKFGIPCTAWGARSETVYYARKIARKLFSSTYGIEYASRDFSVGTAVTSLDASLRRLRTDYLDFYFIHEPLRADDLRATGDLMDALDDQKRKGKILHYGIAAPAALLMAVRQSGLAIGDTAQFEMSPQATELLATFGSEYQLFSYGLFRHLSAGSSNRRLDPAGTLRWFFGHFPAVVPIVATNRESELLRLERALVAVR